MYASHRSAQFHSSQLPERPPTRGVEWIDGGSGEPLFRLSQVLFGRNEEVSSLCELMP
jgi:hypothetical protein